MAEKEEKPQMAAEVVKANQGIAAQAALRAQQIMFRQKLNAVSISGDGATQSAAAALKKSAPPQVPVRGDSVLTKKPPEIPPKRNSLKKPLDGIEDASANNKQPPPLPQKPGSAQNSPLPVPKLKDKPPQVGMRPVPPTPQMPAKFDRPPANLPASTTASTASAANVLPSTNPFANLRNSPQLNQRSNSIPSSASTAAPPPPPSLAIKPTPKPAKKPSISPIEDFGAEDALRGIESGLRNMERAMAEQMNMRSIEAAATAAAIAAQANEKRAAFNPIDFKRSIGGSATSLDGSGNNIMTSSTTSSSSASGSTQNMSVIESMRLALNKNMRSMERGFSMEQMRMDQLHLNNSMRNFEANGAGGAANGVGGGRPFENHMKSLDRNLPLELQYSRHTRSHSQQETLMEQLRHHNLVNPMAAAAAAAAAAHSGSAAGGGGGVGGGTGLSRDDIRLRRRSSHDENQLAQAQAQNTNGGNQHQSFTKHNHSSLFSVWLDLV